MNLWVSCYNGNNDRSARVLFVQHPWEQGEWLRQNPRYAPVLTASFAFSCSLGRWTNNTLEAQSLSPNYVLIGFQELDLQGLQIIFFLVENDHTELQINLVNMLKLYLFGVYENVHNDQDLDPANDVECNVLYNEPLLCCLWEALMWSSNWRGELNP